MHKYPKVFRYDHEALPEGFWDEELIVTEKVDGTNIRFQLYEEQFSSEYTNQVLDCSPDDGDIVFGTRRSVRGCVSDNLEDINGALHNIVRELRRVDTNAIREIHDTYGPIVWYAEGMSVYSSLDYDFSAQSKPLPPPLLGFDAYASRADSRERIPPNPFEQTFEGFLDTKTALQLFDDIGITPVADPNSLTRVTGSELDLEDYDFPESKFADVTVEGVVFRNESYSESIRAKLVRESFKELNREAFGWNEDDVESPEEKFVAIFCPNARIHKIAKKYAEEHDVELKMNHIEEIWPRVYDDIWEEEWMEIKSLDFAFNPSVVKKLVAKRTAATVKRLIITAKINNVRPRDVW